MNTSYYTRLATADELPALRAIELAAARRFSESDLPEPMRSGYTVPVQYLQQAFNRQALWVAQTSDNQLAGYSIMREADNLALLYQLDVLPQYGKQGIGRELVLKAISRAEELDYNVIYLTTFRHIAWNAPFYAKLGFIIMPDDELPPALLDRLNQERALLANRVAMAKRWRAATGKG